MTDQLVVESGKANIFEHNGIRSGRFTIEDAERAISAFDSEEGSDDKLNSSQRPIAPHSEASLKILLGLNLVHRD